MDTISRAELTGSFIAQHGYRNRRSTPVRVENVCHVWYYQYMKTILSITAVSAIILTGCASGPTAEEIRANQCEAFANLTPGYLEISNDFDVLGDSSADNKTQGDSLYNLLKRTAPSSEKRGPYDCDVDVELFEQYIADKG